MKYILNICCVIVLTLLSLNSIAAVRIVQCVDEEGNKSFQKTCPPGSTQIDEKNISTGSKAAAANKPLSYSVNTQSVSATMYSIPKCSPCDAVRELMQIKNVSLTEKNVKDDIELQGELTELNGSLNVPLTLIGDEKLSGYNRAALIAALKKIGWEDPNEVPEETSDEDETSEEETSGVETSEEEDFNADSESE